MIWMKVFKYGANAKAGWVAYLSPCQPTVGTMQCYRRQENNSPIKLNGSLIFSQLIDYCSLIDWSLRVVDLRGRRARSWLDSVFYARRRKWCQAIQWDGAQMRTRQAWFHMVTMASMDLDSPTWRSWIVFAWMPHRINMNWRWQGKNCKNGARSSDHMVDDFSSYAGPNTGQRSSMRLVWRTVSMDRPSSMEEVCRSSRSAIERKRRRE